MTCGLIELALLLAIQGTAHPADLARNAARGQLEAGDAAAAEVSARKAVELSARFQPEAEIEARPDKGLLFEDMIEQARDQYRERRASYFQVLGDTLAAQDKWAEAHKAYLRSADIEPDPRIYLRRAEDPSLSVAERVDLLLSAYLTPGADRASLEQTLLATNVFRSRNALKASLDRRRCERLTVVFPDLELLPDAFPRTQADTDQGPFTTTELFRVGTRLFVYFPVDTCAHCSEQLDGLTLPVMELRRGDRPVFVAAFVPESDLPIARRIVRLLGMEVGVGRTDGLPPVLEPVPTGEIRVVARGGLTQIRIPMSSEVTAAEIRRRIEAINTFLDEPGLPTEDEPEEASVTLVELERNVIEQRQFFGWLDQLERLEVGPAPVGDLYSRLNRLALNVARDSGSRDFGFDMLDGLERIRGGVGAKTTALGILGERMGERLLEEAQSVDPEVRSTPSGERGRFLVATEAEGDPRTVALQRSFLTGEGLRPFSFVLEDTGEDLTVTWVAEEEGTALGVESIPAGSVFHSQPQEGCRMLRLVRGGGLAYEGCDAMVLDGEIVEVRSAVVDDVPDPPTYYRRNVVEGGEESALARGLRLFEEGDMRGALAAFEQAEGEVDPEAPYDVSDIRFNRARALEELGQRQEALALYRAIGDVSYQDTVDDGAGRIEGAPR